MQISPILKAKLRNLPDKPGCYLMRDAGGRIIYVGKAFSLRKRVQSYFRAATLRSAAPKLRSLAHSVHDIDVILARNEASAILTEDKLIKDYQPRFNILLRDDKRFPFLNIALNQPWPRFRLCRIKRRDGSLYFGPYISSAAARAALEFVEKKYGLRVCNVAAPDQETHRHCLDNIFQHCSAPCLGRISETAYRARVNEALAFLRGERPAALDELQASMAQTAAELNYEKAAAIRDLLRRLRDALKQKARLVRPRSIAENGNRSVQALQAALGLRRRPNLIQAVDISNISGCHAVGSIVAAIKGVCRPAGYRRFRIVTVKTVDDVGMMAEVIERHFKRLRDERRKLPDLLLVDGGITQLRAARKTLRKLGLPQVAAAGLAKKFEEIYLETEDGRATRRLALAHDSPALQLLQRIRDEAHRFAHAYHRRLRARLIRESILDEIPGLGAQRKQTLLRHFGAPGLLAKASEKEIAALAGIGPGLARKIKIFLNRRPA